MKNKYLIYLGIMGTLTPVSILFWVWLVIDFEALATLIPDPIKFYTMLGGILLSIFFAGITIYFMMKSRTECHHCGMRMEQQIIQAEKLSTVGQLAGGVAHEVNTPAAIISGRVETMLMDPNNFSNRDRQDLDVIKKQAERISEITRGLLFFAKRTPADKRKVDLNDIVSESLFLIASQLIKAKIEIIKDIYDKPVVIYAQQNQLVQVLLNLLTNARDSMPNGGKIEITTEVLNGERKIGMLRVSDTGYGISSQDLGKIFDPFYTTKKTGTGLGLSVSYGIVQAHGGHIHVHSKAGEGSTFSVLLPLSVSSV